MLDKIKALFEKHPYVSAGAVFVVGAIVIYSFSKSAPAASTSSASTSANGATAAQIAAEASVDQAQVQAASQLAIAQAGAATQQNQINAQLTALQTNDATQISLAQITAANNASLNTTNVDGSIEIAGIQAGVDNNANNNATAVQIDSINQSSLVDQYNTMAQTAQVESNNYTTGVLATIEANQANTSNADILQAMGKS